MTQPIHHPSPLKAYDTASERDERWGKALLWWRRLQPLRQDGSPNHESDRGALARLRRAGTPLDILNEEAVFGLHRALGYGGRRADQTLVSVAIAASVLARVREHDPTRKPARAAGREWFADRDLETAALSPGRLRRLLAAREPDDVHRQMRRLVDLCGPKLDVGALAILILDWFDEARGRKTRTRFAYDYYAAGGDLPDATPDPIPPSA